MKHTITIIGNIGGEYKEGFANNENRSYTNTIFESQGKDKESQCFPFSVWNGRADTLRSFAPKGTLIALELEVSSKFGSGDTANKIFTNFTCVGFKLLPNKKTDDGTRTTDTMPEPVHDPLNNGDDILWD